MISRSALILSAALTVAVSVAQAKIVHTKDYDNTQLAVEACAEGDVLLFDGGTPAVMSDPPNDLQVIGGSGQWELSKDVRGMIFFKHTPLIKQTAGRMIKCRFNELRRGSKFTGLDSCEFIGLTLDHRANPYIEIDGFLRATTMVFTGYIGSSNLGLTESQIEHRSVILINATDPAGDGSGTLIANIVTHSQGDWTPVHILNGRRITVAHTNSEYTEWADPYVSIENGVECAIVHTTPGGRVNFWKNTSKPMNDGTLGFSGINTRNGLYHIGGQANMLIGGVNYVSYRNMVTSWSLTDIALRDPYFQRWNARAAEGVNLAPSMRNFGFGSMEIGGPGSGVGSNGFVMSELAACSTSFISDAGALSTGELKANSLPAGPKLVRSAIGMWPRLKLDDGGPGEDYTNKSDAEIKSALDAGKEIYLGAGTYNISGTLNSGRVWGAGIDQTTLVFPAGSRCLETGANAHNLTIEGGTVGWAQTRKWNATDNEVQLVRFRGQSICGVTLGNAQQNYVALLEFENCVSGVTACDDEIPCGEDDTPGGSSMIDKVNFYACNFKNLTYGAALGIGNNGYTSFVGCRFESCQTGIRIDRTRGTDGKCEGHYIAASDFIGCGKATDIEGSSVAHNCTIEGQTGSYGFTGDFEAIISCSITGSSPAVEVSEDFAVVSDIQTDGSIDYLSNTWIGASTFSNANCPNGAYYGGTDLTDYVVQDEFIPDQTAPSAPTNVRSSDDGDDVVVQWDAAEDPESGILQYIIYRDGGIAGRTDFTFAAYPHFNETHPDGYGTYRHKTTFVDKGQGGRGNTYDVVAVNSARMLSNGKMDLIMLFPHNRFAKPQGQYMYKIGAADDSVVVPPGSPIVPATMRPYKALAYPEHTQQSVSISREAGRPALAAPRSSAPRNGIVTVYDIMGRVVARVKAGDLTSWRAQTLRSIRNGAGVYVLRMPNGGVRTISIRR